jgi:hypothetical protein
MIRRKAPQQQARQIGPIEREYLLKFQQWALDRHIEFRCPQHADPNPFCSCYLFSESSQKFSTAQIEALKRDYWSWNDGKKKEQQKRGRLYNKEKERT